MKGLLLLGGLSLIHAVEIAEKLSGKIDIGDIEIDIGDIINEVKECVTLEGSKWCPILSKCLDLDEECVVDEKNLVGDDEDEKGCTGSAGYKWCENLKDCFRPWELKADWDVTCNDKEDDDENEESAVETESVEDSDLSRDAMSKEVSSDDQPSVDSGEASEDISTDDSQESTVSDDSISTDVSSVGGTIIESQEDSVEVKKQVSASEDLSIDESQEDPSFVEDESKVSASEDESTDDSQEDRYYTENEFLVSSSEDLSSDDSEIASDLISNEFSLDTESLEEEEESSSDMEIDSMEISDDSFESSSDGFSLESGSMDYSSIQFSLEDKIREFMSLSEDSFDGNNEESSSIDLSMDKDHWWSDFDSWLEEKEFVDEEESSSYEDSSDWDSSSVDSLEDKIRGFMSENEDIWDKYYDGDSSSGEFSMDNMDWWPDFNRWLVEKDYVDEKESFSEEDFSIEEWDSSSFDSTEDKIREFMSENQDIWDKYYNEDTSSNEFSMENFNRWVRDETSTTEKDWFSEFSRWLVEQEKDSSSYIESKSMDESSSSDGSRSSSSEEKSSSNDDSSSRVSSSDVGANFEENGSSSDEPCDKGKGWLKGEIYKHKQIIITLSAFLAIIACLVIMETKRKRDRGRRSMRIQMLSSGSIVDTPAVKYLHQDSKARKSKEKADGSDYQAFTNLV